jgi:hypothetical protein
MPPGIDRYLIHSFETMERDSLSESLGGAQVLPMLVRVIHPGIVLHETFRDENNKTRIIAVWDQNDWTGPAPTVQGRLLHGTVHSAADINSYISDGNVPPMLGRNPARHGTHVTSIAVGRATSKFFGGVPVANLIRLAVDRESGKPIVG